MLLTIVATFAGVTHGGFAPVGPLRGLLFTSVGLDVGLRFTKKTVRHIRRLFPLVLVCTLAVSASCAVLAWALAQLTRIPFMDAYLATTPGGINAVLATAIATGANVPLISTVQSLRLIAMVLLAPLIIRMILKPRSRTPLAADRAELGPISGESGFNQPLTGPIVSEIGAEK
jgi:membrane AbrB-like protein